jgi:hypothetical protein
MAISNLNLNVTANTARALADFNKFSRSLDNKFLISGLKLDVVRGALSQINRDFQRAIGEQGLASASSLRAAQNQAALLTQTFKGFASESALAITTNIGTALNQVAVTAGGTMKDVQKTLLATPFISTRLSEDVRLGLSKGVLDFQKNIRRAGLGDNFGGVAQQFLMGTKTTMQMVQSGNPLEMFLGSELIKRGAGVGEIASPEVRSKLMKDLVEDSALGNQLKIAAKRAAGFRIILEDMNSTLFNPESGVFGSLKKVVDAAGNSTTMFDEVEKLVEQVFGDNGMFATLVKSLRSVFGSGDPMRPFIDGVQFMTRIFKSITDYFNTPGFKAVLGYVKDIVERVTTVFTGIYQQIRGSSFSSSEITRTIGEIGESIRGYIRQFGETIRNKNVSGESGFAGDILGTLVEEVGRTAVVLIKELLMTLVNKVPEIATQILPAINKGINAMFTEIFGSGLAGKVVKMVLGFVPGPIGMIARASAVGDVTGGGGNTLSMLAMGAGALLGPGAMLGLGRGVMGAGTFARQVSTQRGRFSLLNAMGNRAYGFETNLNRRLFLDDPLTGANRFSPLSRRIIDPLSGRIRPSTSFASVNPNFYPSSPNTNYFPSSINPLYGPSSILPPRSPWHDRISLPGYQVGGPSSELGRITPESSMFNPMFGGYMTPQEKFMRGEKLRRESLIRRGMINTPERIGGRFSILGRITRESSMFVPRTSSGLPSPRGRGTTQYTRVIGPQPHGYHWAHDPQYRGVSMGGDYAPFIESSSITPRERLTSARSRIGRRFGAAALIGGTLASVLGTSAQASTGEGGVDNTAMIQNLLMSGGGAAMAFGPWGAAIGGIMMAGSALMDKGVREAVGKLVTNMGVSLSNTVEWFTKGTQENWSKAKDSMGSAVKFFVNGLVGILNGILTVTQVIPRLMMGMLKGLISKVPGADKIPGLSGLIGAGDSLANFSIPTMYGGMGYAGPAMALEARMSGRRPMVVNDGEFVIPRDGFPTLAGLVGDNLRSTGVVNQGTSQPVQVNVTLAITTNAVVADPNELANALREPVYKIIGEAWNEAYNSTRIHRPKVS